MKTFTAIFTFVFILSGMAMAQSLPRGGFAAVPAPGQPVVPEAVTPTPPVTTPQPPGVARPTTPAAPAGQQQQEQLRIVADPATNSLIIYGTAQEFQNIKNILKDLDAVPRQVLLDVMIAEITHSDDKSLGVDYEVLRRNPQSIFGQQFRSAAAIRTLGDVFPSNNAFGQGITGVFGGQDVKALVNALQGDSRVKILSSPTILATDNRPARIQVGSEEPVATGTITGAVGTVASSTTIQYRNTGRIVTIIPQVNSMGLVNLQILAEVSQRGTNVRVGNANDQFPTFDTRQAETTAVVQDGDTLAIGGIIAEKVTRDRTGIPYLMDIPVVGRFFGTTSDSIRRTELVMLITPRVIRNRDEARSITQDFKNGLAAVRNELERIARDRAKLVPPPAMQPQVPMPEPGLMGPPLQPLPGSVVPGQGAALPSTGPFAGSAFYPNALPSTPVAPMGGRPEEAIGVYPAPEVQREPVAPKPQGFALSLAPVEVKPPVQITVHKPVVAAKTVAKSGRVWAVQVAALADNKDAESMAARLRRIGHQAYVMTTQVTDKIWHRVRIGKFEEQNDAHELRKTLSGEKEFRQAYVAAN